MPEKRTLTGQYELPLTCMKGCPENKMDWYKLHKMFHKAATTVAEIKSKKNARIFFLS